MFTKLLLCQNLSSVIGSRPILHLTSDCGRWHLTHVTRHSPDPERVVSHTYIHRRGGTRRRRVLETTKSTRKERNCERTENSAGVKVKETRGGSGLHTNFSLHFLLLPTEKIWEHSTFRLLMNYFTDKCFGKKYTFYRSNRIYLK